MSCLGELFYFKANCGLTQKKAREMRVSTSLGLFEIYIIKG